MQLLRPPGAPPLRTVFLDLGDTLMYIHPSVPELYLGAARDLGVDCDAVAVDHALLAGERHYRDALRARRSFESSVADARSFWREYHLLVVGALGVPEGERRDGLANALSERFWSPDSWRVFPEVHDVLGRLRAAGLQLAVVSNFTDTLAAVCSTHELDGYFDCIVASASVGAQKPDVAIFREALRRTGADPAASLHVGDNYLTDVLGARAGGITGVLLDRANHGGRPPMFDFSRQSPTAGMPGPRLDCPVIGDLTALLSLIDLPGGRAAR